MDENRFSTEPGTQQDYQTPEDIRREYENPAGDNSTLIDENERATPNEFPERRQQHDYKDPSASQFENEEDEVDTDTEIFDQDEEDEGADPVEEQSPGNPDRSERRPY